MKVVAITEKIPPPMNESNDQEVKDLKDLIQELIDSGDISQTQIAREAGMSSSAVSTWLRGKYAGDNVVLEQKLQIWWESREIRAKTTSSLPAAPRFVETPSSKKIENVLSYAQMAGDLAVIYGGAGVGKTTTSREYSISNPSVWIATMIPDASGICACLEEIADAVGLKVAPGLGAARLRREIVKRITATGGLLIVDEAQHLSLSALEEVRSIHDATGIGVVLCGNESVYSRLIGNSRAANFAQLFSRIGKRLRLNRPSNGDVLAIMEVFKVSGAEEQKVLSDIAARPGALRGVVKSLRLGSMFAKGSGQPLTVARIREAWKDLGGEEG